MTAFKSLLLALTVVAMTATAEAAPRIVFKGCAVWTTPTCLMMKATNRKTYSLVGAGPAFPAGRRVIAYGRPSGDVGLCFAPSATITRFKVLPPGPC